MKPYSHKIFCDNETPVSIYLKLAQKHPYAFLFESAEVNKASGRYSFIGFEAQKLFVFNAGSKQNPLEILKSEYQKINYESDAHLPSLQAGFVGYFCYEIVRHFEKIKLPLPENKTGIKKSDTIPEGIFFLPKNLLIFDHHEHTLTFVAYSAADLKNLIAAFKKAEQQNTKAITGADDGHVGKPAISAVAHPANSDLSAQDFKKIVSIAKEKIVAGEIFQIVLSQQFSQKTELASFHLYRKMRLLSPSPYMFYLQYPDFSIIGSSPETLVKTEKNKIILRPIAGTRRRGKTVAEDQKLAIELKNDPKEKAEHMMLVDLGRNDLGRVAEPGSVKVNKLMQVQKYSHVMHLVSELSGKRRKDQTLFDIFRAAFPAGTLTGAPKIRAMEIIAKLEKTPRQIYGGAVGYFDLSGNMDFAIAIRTMLYKNGTVNLRAGAGIVYDSIPEQENQECHNKAKGPLAAIN